MMTGRKSLPCPVCGAALGRAGAGLAGQLLRYTHKERIQAACQPPKNRGRRWAESER